MRTLRETQPYLKACFRLDRHDGGDFIRDDLIRFYARLERSIQDPLDIVALPVIGEA